MFFLWFYLICSHRNSKTKYGVMIDAGSAGTRAHIFTWTKGASNPDIRVLRQDSQNSTVSIYKTSLALSKAADNYSVVSHIFDPIIKFCTISIPQKSLSKTKIYVFATAGLRMLEISKQAAILEKVYERLSNSPFKIDRSAIKIMSGSEEAIYGWISVNYQIDSFGHTNGAIDMGGASTQVAFEVSTKQPPSDEGDVHQVRYKGKNYNLFTISYLGFGVNEALKRSLKQFGSSNPCFPVDYVEESVKGSGDFGRCVLETEKTIDKRKKIRLSGDFYSMASFVYVNQFFNLPYNSSISDLENAGVKYCSSNWTKILADFPNTKPDFLRYYCFFSSFQRVFLGGAFGFDFGTVFKYPEINGVELSWAIGAMMNEAGLIEIDKLDIFRVSMYVFSLLIIFSFLFAVNYLRNSRSGILRAPANKYL